MSTNADGQIQQAALEAGMDTQAFCDMNCRTFEARIHLRASLWKVS